MHNKPNTTYSGHELCSRTAYEVVQLLRQGDVSPGELVAASSQRIEQIEPSVNAMPTRCLERAQADAKHWHEQSKCHHNVGHLSGLPIAIKDLNAVKGVRSTWGSIGLKDYIPEYSDYVVERLEQRGGIVMGKTNSPEMGAGGNTFNEVFGRTRNPWNTHKNAGGSSGGAAVSLATGEVWLSHGSDLAGSLRTPAAYCGVVGFRASPGVVPSGPSSISFQTEAVSGPMARNVLDCALFLDAMAGIEPRAPVTWPLPTVAYQKAVLEADEKERIAYSRDWHGFTTTSNDMDRILRQALSQVEAQGGTVDEACPELPGLDHAYRVYRSMLWASGPGRAPEAVQKHFKPTLLGNIEYGRNLNIDDVYDANINRAILYANMQQFLTTYDVLACPVVGLHPGPVEEEYPSHIDGQPLGDYIEWLKFSYLSTITGLPSVSVPVGFTDDGMPVGIQLIGPPHGEARLLAVARAVEQAVGGPLSPIDPVSPANPLASKQTN